MYLLYNLLTILFLPLIALYCLLRPGEAGLDSCSLAHRLGLSAPHRSIGPVPSGERVWIHAVCLGEVQAAGALIRALREKDPSLVILLSTGTSAGSGAARELDPGPDLTFHLPFDLRWAMRRLIAHLNPRALVTVETEIWPNLLREAHRQGVEVVMVNGRISSRSFPRYRRLRAFFGRVLSTYSQLNMISGRDRERIIAIGADPDRVQVTGNMKYDRLPEEAEGGDPRAIRCSLGLRPREPVLVAGSTHSGEEEVLLLALREIRGRGHDLVLILAPRRIRRAPELLDLAHSLGFETVLKTDLDSGARRAGEPVIILDTFGELFAVYSVATITFCGKSLVPKGGQNILEPAAWGKVVLHGPHLDNFPGPRELLSACGAGIEIASRGELVEVACQLLEDPQRCRRLGQAGKETLRSGCGAAEKNAEALLALLS